jgi:hypothetical protein
VLERRQVGQFWHGWRQWRQLREDATVGERELEGLASLRADRDRAYPASSGQPAIGRPRSASRGDQTKGMSPPVSARQVPETKPLSDEAR